MTSFVNPGAPPNPVLFSTPAVAFAMLAAMNALYPGKACTLQDMAPGLTDGTNQQWGVFIPGIGTVNCGRLNASITEAGSWAISPAGQPYWAAVLPPAQQPPPLVQTTPPNAPAGAGGIPGLGENVVTLEMIYADTQALRKKLDA